MDAIEIKLIEIIKKYTFDKKVWDNYSIDMRIIKDLKINSARIVDIILDMEDEFKIDIDNDVIEKLITISDAINLIKKKKIKK